MTNEPLTALLARMPCDDAAPPLGSEGDLRTALAAYLRAHAWAVAERVPCTAGEADLVACQNGHVGVIEVKLALTRRMLHEAASQVLAYRLAIDPTAEAIVVGYARPGTATAVAAVESLGVGVVMLKTEGGRLKHHAPRPTSPQPSAFSLQWSVQSFARSRGITTVGQLVQVTGLPKQTLYRVWRGATQQISVPVLG